MKYTLITGASSGLGRETAIYLSESRNLILNARNIERLEETKSLCKSTSDIILWPYDLSLINDLELNFVEFIKNIRLERSIEIEFEAFVQYTRKLQFTEVPNYGYLKSLLKTIIKS